MSCCGPPSSAGCGRLPRLFGRAVVVAWRAARRQLLGAAALQLVGGAGLAAELLVARRLLQVVLAGGQRVALGTVMPELLVLAAVGAVVGFTNLAAAEQQRILSEMVAQYAASQVLEVAGAVDLVAFERPEFYDRLLRAQLNAQIRPQQVVNGLLGVLGGLFATAGIAVALVVLQPLVLVLLVEPISGAGCGGGDAKADLFSSRSSLPTLPALPAPSFTCSGTRGRSKSTSPGSSDPTD
jgi:ATP-binding cassette subfamily B protein